MHGTAGYANDCSWPIADIRRQCWRKENIDPRWAVPSYNAGRYCHCFLREYGQVPMLFLSGHQPLGGIMGRKLYVGNLPYSATESAISDKFAECGTVESCKLITDRDTGQNKGFGFIEMASDSEAHAAIDKFNGTDYDGRPMKVNEARPQEKRSSGGGGGGSGYGGGGSRW